MTGLTRDAARGVSWLANLARSRAGWSWPRLMTGVHPDATGSLGAKAIKEIEQWSGRPLWPWQRLVIMRALEHDARGRLVWRSVGLTVPRQQGKSTVIGELAAWRLRSGDRFGGQQNVLLVARDVGAAVTVQKPHRLRAEADRKRFKPSAAGGRLSIEWLRDGSEWLIRSSEGVYSYSAVMAIADEAWDLAPSVVDDGLAPVILQQSDAQLWCVSTANLKATGLMLGRRAAAIAELDEPTTTLWLEWSLAPDDPLDDPQVWKASCPRWTEDIAARYADLYASALARRPSDPVADDPMDSFSAQYGNRWPVFVEPQRKGELLVDLEAWAAARDDLTPQGPVVCAIEDYGGEGAALVVVGHCAEDDRLYLQAELQPNRSAAFDLAGVLLESYPSSRLLVGASMGRDERAVALWAKGSGQQEVTVALPLLRELLAAGRIAHFPWTGVPCPLTAQLADARVRRTATGALALVPGVRLDAVRAALMALHAMEYDPPMVPAIY